MRDRRQTNRGGSLMDFCFVIPFWVPLLLGTVFIGTAMIRGQEVTQMARDLGSMYSRGVNFSSGGGAVSNSILAQITQPLGSVTTGGNGAVVFSTILYVGKSVCAQAGLVDASGTPTAACTNYRHFVFSQQYVQGNKASVLSTSSFGTAPAGDLDDSFNVSLAKYATDSNDQASFHVIKAPLEDGKDGYQSGGLIYVVEVKFTGPALSGYTGGNTYAYAIF